MVSKVTSNVGVKVVDQWLHGSRYHRRPGSMGVIINRVMKGKLLPGRMGGKRVTIQNLEIVKADTENGVLFDQG